MPNGTVPGMVEIEPGFLLADREFRAAHTGAEAEYLAPRAREMFAGIGLHLTEPQLDEYVDSVTDGRPFQFVLD